MGNAGSTTRFRDGASGSDRKFARVLGLVAKLKMFIHVSYPVVDLRAFGTFDRLKKPGWPNPVTDRDFVRSFGVVRPRLRGGLTGFASEDIFVNSLRITFDPRAIASMLGLPFHRIKVIFRRLYCTGGPLVHFDVGICIYGKTAGSGELDLQNTIEAILGSRISVAAKSVTVATAGPHIARHFLRATTPHGATFSDGLVKSNTPTLVVESFGANNKPLTLVRLSDNRRLTPVWIIASQGHWTGAQSRALRLTLIRLRSEREVLRTVLSSADEGSLVFEPYTSGGDRLSSYLRRADRLFAGKIPDELVTVMPQDEYSAVLSAALEADQLFQPGAVGRLETSFRDIRPNILRKLYQLSAADEKRSLLLERAKDLNVKHLEIVVNETSVSIGPSTGSVIVVGNENTTTASITVNSGSKEIDELVKQLLEKVNELANQLPKDDAEIAINHARAVASEVQKESPNRKWYEVSADGLKEATKAVGSLVPSIGRILLDLGKLVFGAS
jgi:hypothetical protein